MSLATRCTACGTVFRVVQDQLKVSEGWVRCGRCAEVFDARQHLFDLEHEAPAPESSQAQVQEDTEDSGFEETRVELTYHDESYSSDLSSAREAWEMGRPENAGPFGASDAEGRNPHAAYSREQAFDRFAAPDDYLPDDETQYSSQRDLDGLAAGPDDSPLSPPSFVRHAAKGRARLSPLQRDLWASAGVLLALLLALQALFHFRDALAAADPQAEIYLKRLCQTLSCEIRPLQRIDALSVEASSLTRLSGNAKRYQLAVSLRNRSDSTLALPSFDLSLTDSSGNLLARRVLSPADFAASGPATDKAAGTIAARSQLSLQAILQTGDTGLVGYSVEVFYP